MYNLSPKIQKETGSHYTPKELADFVSKQILFNFPNNQKDKIRILDPAVGDGELLLALSKYLIENQYSNFELYGFDTNSEAINYAKYRIKEYFPDSKVNLFVVDFLQYVLENYTNHGLFKDNNLEQFDVVITNPPYVRTQIMGADKSQNLAKLFSLSGRVDLYHAFLKGLSFILKENGIAGIIVSNRFMYIKSGETIREDLLTNFEIKGIWDFGDTKLFNAAVLPAVIILQKVQTPKNKNVIFTSIYTQKTNKLPEKSHTSIFEAFSSQGQIRLTNNETYLIKKGLLEFGNSNKNVWRLSENESNKWLTQISQNSDKTFGQIGTVRVGVKTTADKIFIRDDWEKIKELKPEDELLKPLITHKMANQYKANEIDRQIKILYPYTTVNGKRSLLNLNNYPRTLNYFKKYKELLSSRKYLIESGREWYEIWVPQQPSNWLLPKLIFWDISLIPTFWINTDGAIVNGDCYWFTLNETRNIDLLYLCLAVGNSSFIEQFYDIKFNNKLYAGRRRFQAQYVNNFPLPKINNIYSKQIIANTKTILETSDKPLVKKLIRENNELVFKSFGVESLE